MAVVRESSGARLVIPADVVLSETEYHLAPDVVRLKPENRVKECHLGSLDAADRHVCLSFLQLSRDRLAQQKEWKTPKLLDPPPPERIKTRLSRIESGQTGEWLWLVCDLTLEPTSQHTTLPGPNLTVLPGWVAAEESTRERIVAAAERYVNDGEPENETWIGTAAMPGVAITGYHALSLLLIVSEERLNTLEPKVWRKWLPTLVRYGTMEKDELQVGTRLLRRAYAVAPAEAITWIERVIDSENERTGYFFAFTEIEACWDERMGEALLQKVADPILKPATLAGLFALLGRHGVSGWRERAESFIDESAMESEDRKSRMRGAIEALLMNASDAGWASVWPILTTRRDFGRQVIESLSYGRPGGLDFVKNLTEPQLGELYIWMVEN